MGTKSKVIVALDAMSLERATELAAILAPAVWGFKVNDLLLAEGIRAIEELKKFGNVFADAKIHEIPNTTKNSVNRLASAGADLITVHASGGAAMLQAAADAAGQAKILGVTALTSLADEDTKQIFGKSPLESVRTFAGMASASGIYGIVCSPQELKALASDEDFKKLAKVCPGVRPAWYSKSDDQQRVATPSNTISDGATLLVIGRPITSAEDPLAATERINAELP